jgi:protein SCO1
LKIIRYTAWATVLVIAFLAGSISLGWFKAEWLGMGRPSGMNDQVAFLAGPFTSTNHRGEKISEATFRGKATAYFFGFTHCPDICPTSLTDMSERLRALGPDGDKLNVVFVTVDPERDSPQLLSQYLSAFDPRIVALSGSRAETDAMIKTFKVKATKEGESDSYVMNHTTSVLLFDAKGEFVSLIDYHEEEPTALAKIRRALDA